MKYSQKRPQIGMTCFVFDGRTWRRSDFFSFGMIWSKCSIANIIYPDPILPSVYRSPLLPKRSIQKFRCSFGHDFEGNNPPNGRIKVHAPGTEISTHLPFLDFDLDEEMSLIPEMSTQKQKEMFESTIHLQPSYYIS